MAIGQATASFTRPASATQYTSGDSISNSGTGSAVVPLTFRTRQWGKVIGARCVVTPASSNLVITALDFNLILFRPVTSIPFAAGSFIADNGVLAVPGAAAVELVGTIAFVNNAWINPAGALTAGAIGYQRSTSVTPAAPMPFSLGGGAGLIGILQAQAAWNPGNIANAFSFALDIDSGDSP